MFSELRRQQGLTLIELMVVVAIVAIIAAVAISVFQDIQKKAKLGADYAHVAAMRSAVAIYYGKKNGLFPPDIATVYTLVRPPLAGGLGGASFHCQVPTYTAANGKVDYSATIGDCP